MMLVFDYALFKLVVFDYALSIMNYFSPHYELYIALIILEVFQELFQDCFTA